MCLPQPHLMVYRHLIHLRQLSSPASTDETLGSQFGLDLVGDYRQRINTTENVLLLKGRINF